MNNMNRMIIILSICLTIGACPNNQVEDPDSTTPVHHSVQDAGSVQAPSSDAGDTTLPPDVEVVDAGVLPPQWFECQVDRDCVLYEEGCCDHCNGGTLWSVNTSYLQALKEAYPDPTDAECVGIMCTRRMCFEMAAVCEEGACAATQDLPPATDLDAGPHTLPIEDAGSAGVPLVPLDAGGVSNVPVVVDAGMIIPLDPSAGDAGTSDNDPQDVWFQCSMDDDCVIHEYGCCDYCAGGNLISVHEDYLDEAQAHYTSPPVEICSGWACITLACPNEEAYCNEGQCDHRSLGWGGPVEPVDAGPGLDDTDANNDGFPDAWFTCSDVSDCVDYQPGCCDYCNGGPIFVVHNDYLDELQAVEPSLTSEVCNNVQCSIQYCLPPSLTCENNVCGYQQ
jgi:hypothetical protein